MKKKILMFALSVFIFSPPIPAGECPWKVTELENNLTTAEQRTILAWRSANEKDVEIASIRRAVNIDCKNKDLSSKITQFKPEISGIDINSEVTTASNLLACIDEKRGEAKIRIANARKSGDRISERRLLELSSMIERLSPRVFDHAVTVNQLASKLERLHREYSKLINACEVSDF